MPWQQAAVDVAFEYDPVTGLLRYDEVDITVPRQSGKTTLTLAKKVHRLTVMAKKLGPQRSTYTAQTRLAARKKLERDFAAALSASRSFREVPHARARPTKATEWRLTLNNGSEAIQFGTGSYLQIDAPSRTGGHGDTLDDGTIDEAFSQEDDTVEGSMRPAMATRKNAQLWVISTAGDERSAYLWRKVLAGRAAAESGEHGRVCYIEYSAPEDADPADPEVWRSCMPALGITVTEQFVQGEWERAQRKGPEGIDTFRRAYLNQWPQIPLLRETAAGGVIAAELWTGLADPRGERGTDPTFGVDLDEHRIAQVTVVTKTDVGFRAEMASDPVPAHLLSARLLELVGEWGGQVAAPTILVDELERAGLPVSEVKSSAWPQACAGLLDRIDAGMLRHGNQPTLNDAVTAVRWGPTSTSGHRSFLLRNSPGAGPAFALVRALHVSGEDQPAEFYTL